MANVVLDKVSKRYGNGAVVAVNELSLEIADGEFLVLVGPSGCGKSTALRMIAGLEEITSGEVVIGGEVVNDVHAKDRDIAMVFQNYALYPHMSVFENMAFALEIARRPRAEIRRKVEEVAKILQLEPYLDRRPGQLSGGQRQRVAMGRAIVREPEVFLMDEPLSNLDAKLRVQMRSEIARIQDRLGVTTIYVTHDQVEAMTMGDRVALMKDGVLQQVDKPSTIYNRPANTFVASFIGSPAMNLYHARLNKGGDGATIQLGSISLDVPAALFTERASLGEYLGREIICGIRPEDMEDQRLVPAHPAGQTMPADVYLAEALGSDNIVHFNIDAPVAEVVDPDTLSDISKSLDGAGVGACVARFDAKSEVRTGDRVTVAVDCARLHFFDPQTGRSIW